MPHGVLDMKKGKLELRMSLRRFRDPFPPKKGLN